MKVSFDQILTIMEDIEFEYIGEDEALEETSDINEDFERRTVRINCDGKKIRGKDFSCTPKIKRGIFHACINIKLYFQVTHLK